MQVDGKLQEPRGSQQPSMKAESSKLRVGDWVEVRSKGEILSTLDGDGRLDGMPFMPEMFAFCGKKFQVHKRAHKTCDTVFPVRGRRVDRAVHLDTRCDGGAHGGCQASCLLFWKDDWLKPVSETSPEASSVPSDQTSVSTSNSSSTAACAESDVWAGATAANASGRDPVYVCQATQLPYATTSLEWWDVRQYVEDYVSGNVSLWRIVCGGVYFLYYEISKAGIGLGRPMRWFYDTFYPVWRGAPFPRRHGTIPEAEATPVKPLDLQPGELVRIKPYKEVLNTLNTRDRNRGLYFDAEEVPYCGKTVRVLKRVTRIIHERTGKMLEMKTPCVILDSVVCESRYSECRLFCPRGIYSYWREIWLERVGPKPSIDGPETAEQAASQGEHALSGPRDTRSRG
jgi:hypothetical protein